MKYTNIIDDMVWSYSRLKTYAACPYQFLLHYIFGEEEEPMFFSDFGGYIHELIAEHLTDGTSSDDLIMKYLRNFRKEVLGSAPNDNMFEKYLDKGAEYIGSIDSALMSFKPLAVEEKYKFKIDGKSFVGIVDMVAENSDGELCIIDHKSRQLKRRSGRKTPTKYDEELDGYLRQLYLYCIPVKKKFGKYPDWLIFNCFRNDEETRLIVEPFEEEKFEEAKKWALDLIEEIRQEDNWDPDEEFWRCKHLCGVHRMCETWMEG